MHQKSFSQKTVCQLKFGKSHLNLHILVSGSQITHTDIYSPFIKFTHSDFREIEQACFWDFTNPLSSIKKYLHSKGNTCTGRGPCLFAVVFFVPHPTQNKQNKTTGEKPVSRPIYFVHDLHLGVLGPL